MVIALGWVGQQVVRQRKKDFNDARIVLQRVAHDVWGNAKELWVSERAIQLLLMWHRYTVFMQCKRAGQGFPIFAMTIEKWDAFVDRYHDRKLRESLSKRLIPLVGAALDGACSPTHSPFPGGLVRSVVGETRHVSCSI